MSAARVDEARGRPRDLLLDLDDLLGRPARLMFEAAARSVGLVLGEVAMVGDDLQADIGGSQTLGIRGFMVRTGKYRSAEVETSAIEPDRVIDSVASLPDLVLR